MKKLAACIMALCVAAVLAGCGDSAREQAPSKTLDVGSLLGAPVAEAVIKAEGKELRITDGDTVREVVEAIERVEFQRSGDADINAPGAVSVTVELRAESETAAVTFPCCLFEGDVYSAGAESVKLFGKYFER